VLVDAFGAKQRHVEIPAGHFLEGTVAGDHGVTREEETARDVDLDAGQAGDELRGGQAGRDDLEVGDPGGRDGFGGEEDRRTRVQVDGHAGLDARGGQIADLTLGLGVLDLAVVEGREVSIKIRQRTTVCTRDPPLAFKFGEIASGGGLGDVKLLTDFQNGNVADLAEEFGDGFAASLDNMASDFHKHGF